MHDLAPKIAEAWMSASPRAVWLAYRHATSDEWLRAFLIIVELAKVAVGEDDDHQISAFKPAIEGLDDHMEFLVAAADRSGP